MAVFKRFSLLCLALLVSSAEATSFSDPIICYVLDAVLLLYSIIFTAMYFKLKFDKAKPFVMQPDKSSNDQAVREEGTYEALVGQSNDEYQEIQKRTRTGEKKSKGKKPRSKSSAAEDFEMKPVPPLPSRA